VSSIDVSMTAQAEACRKASGLHASAKMKLRAGAGRVAGRSRARRKEFSLLKGMGSQRRALLFKPMALMAARVLGIRGANASILSDHAGGARACNLHEIRPGDRGGQILLEALGKQSKIPEHDAPAIVACSPGG